MSDFTNNLETNKQKYLPLCELMDFAGELTSSLGASSSQFKSKIISVRDMFFVDYVNVK